HGWSSSPRPVVANPGPDLAKAQLNRYARRSLGAPMDLGPSAGEPRPVPSGLPALGDVPWGSHLCNFYRDPAELAEALIPYFQAGLANHERCLWIASEPFPVAAALEALRSAVPELERYLASGQLEILDQDEWSARSGPDLQGVVAAWLEHEAE